MSYQEGSNWQAKKEDEKKPLYPASQPQPAAEAGREEKPELWGFANAAQVLSGFMWRDEFQFPLKAIEFSATKGVTMDETILLPWLMKFQTWLKDHQVKGGAKDEISELHAEIRTTETKLTAAQNRIKELEGEIEKLKK